ncbi:MAG: NAD(P)H-dependent oxidoreductase subunit E [Planctomycetes bacterium]|nr:NAD(P)H-dependent oxidoreductase subunit E [Planctomycetota bacterium]
MALPQKLVSEFDQLVKKYPDRKSGLIPALHRCQEELGGWISPQIMEDLAAYFGLEPVEVYGVASFYPMFRMRPVGKHFVSVCHNISCELRGATEILEHVCKVTGAKPYGTSADGQFTVWPVECQGACANAPMIDVDGVYHEDLTNAKVDALLGGLKK